MAQRTAAETERAMVAAYLADTSAGGEAIARQFGVRSSTLYRVLDRHGIARDGTRRGWRYKLSPAQQEEALRRLAAGEVSRSIAQSLGCGREAILDLAKKQGVSPGRGRGRRVEKTDPRLAEVITLRAQGLSQRAIGVQLGLDQTSVSKWLKRHAPEVSKKATGARHVNWRGGRSKTRSGYVQVLLSPDDPLFSMAMANGYVLEHRLVMARALGRPLTARESVHHINGDRTDNRLENLQLRHGKHQAGEVFACADCGSRHIVAVTLA